MGTVLVVEDDRGCCLTLASLIRHSGHRARTACNAEEALGLLRNSSEPAMPDLIIVDSRATAADGLALLRALRTDPCAAHLPVIIFSACNDTDTMSQAREVGVAEYWVKTNFDFTELPRRLNRYVRSDEQPGTRCIEEQPAAAAVPD